MAEPLRTASEGRSPWRRAFAPRPVEMRHGGKLPDSDQDLARLTRVSLLVVGAEDKLAQFMASLWPGLVTPVVVRQRGEPLQLSTIPPVGTFVIHGLETLTRAEQDALRERLDAGNGRPRVVSTASESLFPMVESGAFDDTLYYRLNVVTIDLTSPVPR